MSEPDPELEALGLLLEAPAAPPPPRPRALLLDHLSGRAPFSGFASRFSRIFQLDLDASRRLLGSLPTDPWEPFLPVAALRHFTPGPGLQAPGVDAGFVRFEAGTLFPQHHHEGEEYTLVLQGGFRDELTGRHVRTGDLLVLPPGSTHQFMIDEGEPCLAAVLLLGPISFR